MLEVHALHSVHGALARTDVQFQRSGVRLWWQQVVALTGKNLRVRVLTRSALAKWVTAVLLLVAVILVEATSSEVQTDAVAISTVLCLLAVLLLPWGVFELNEGFLELLKLHRCGFWSVAAAEALLLFGVNVATALFALTVFLVVANSKDAYLAPVAFTCADFRADATDGCLCVIGGSPPGARGTFDAGFVVIGEEPLVDGVVESGVGGWGALLAVSLLFALGLSGLGLLLASLHRKHRVASFTGAVALTLVGLLPPLLTHVHYAHDVFSYPTSWNCSFALSPALSQTHAQLPRLEPSAAADCLSRRLDVGPAARNLVFTNAFFSAVTSFFFVESVTTASNLSGSGSCSVDTSGELFTSIGWLAASALLALAVGLAALRLRAFPPVPVLRARLAVRRWWAARTACWSCLDACQHCSFCSCCDAGRKRRRAGSNDDDDDDYDEAEEAEEGKEERACVAAERERVRALLAGPRSALEGTIVLDGASKTFVNLGSRSRRPTKAVSDVTLAVGRGEIVALLAPNGAGKTTTLHLLNATLAATAGTVTLNGHDVQTQMGLVAPKLGFVGQSDCLWSSLTPRQHLVLVAKLRGISCTSQERADIVAEVSARLDLDECLDRPVSRLSGGMRRRLSVALAMLGSPDIVVLDEPTSHLDPETRRKVWECIQYFRDQYGCSMVITTHLMEEADELCDRIAIMTRGRVRAIDTPQGLKDRFGNGFTLLLTVEHGFRREAFAYVQARISRQAVLGNSLNDVLRIYFPRDGLDIDKAFAALFSAESKSEGRIANWLLNQATLDDVFMNLAGADEGHLAEIGYLNEGDHTLVCKLLRHRGFGEANHANSLAAT